MNKIGWKKRIFEASNAAGTYQEFFDCVIDTLADILARRDKAVKEFEDSDQSFVIEHAIRGGAINYVQNPLIKTINELNRDALSYWQAMGLTAKSYRQIVGDIAPKKESGFMEKLEGLL